MTRTIKFRGQRVDTKEWVYGYLVTKWIQDRAFNGSFVTYIINQETEDNGNIWNFDFEVIPKTVGQFTGLTDKNGKEIYEGDIVRFYYPKGIEYTRTVFWDNGGFCIETFNDDVGNERALAMHWVSPLIQLNDTQNYAWFISTVEIIGNIHEGEK